MENEDAYLKSRKGSLTEVSLTKKPKSFHKTRSLEGDCNKPLQGPKAKNLYVKWQKKDYLAYKKT